MLLLLKSILLVTYLAICVLLRVCLGICDVASDLESKRGSALKLPTTYLLAALLLSLLRGSVTEYDTYDNVKGAYF